FAHMSQEAEAPSSKSPRGWITREVDAFVLSLLQKDPSRRPKDAAALLDGLESMGRVSAQMRAAKAISPEKVDQLIDVLIATPRDSEGAMGLEHAVEEGADAFKVAEAFEMGAQRISGAGEAELEIKKALFFRAARIFDTQCKDKQRAETVYAQIVEIDPTDD